MRGDKTSTGLTGTMLPMRFDLCCGKCRYAVREDWPRNRGVLRCGYEGNGEMKGRVTEEFPRGLGPSRAYPAPAWCSADEKRP